MRLLAAKRPYACAHWLSAKWLVIAATGPAWKHARVSMKILLLVASLIAVTGCTSSMNRTMDVSRPVSFPPTPKSAHPYVIVGLVSLKGSHQKVPVEQLIKQIAVGDYAGQATFTPPVTLTANLEGEYSGWQTVHAVNGVSTTTKGGKTTMQPQYGDERQGIGFALRTYNGQSHIRILARVPTWRKMQFSREWGKLETLSFDSPDVEIGTDASGWQVLYDEDSADRIHPGTNVVLVYLNKP